MNTFRSLFTLFILTWGISLHGQVSKTFSALQYNNSHGLPGTSIYGISQDNKGYMWLGTDQTLCRFDGVSFVTIETNPPIESKAIERVYCLSEDSVLVVGAQPYQVYLVVDGHSSVLDYGLSIPIKGKNLSFSDNDKSILYSFHSTVYQLKHNQNVLRFQLPFNSRDEITTIKNFGNDSFFVASEQSAFFVGKRTHEFKELKGANSFLEQEDQSIITAGDKVYALKGQQVKLLAQFKDPNTRIYKSLLDEQGYLWMCGTNQGLYILQNGMITDITSSISTSGEQITQIFLDRSGNIWIGTAASGLMYIHRNRFTNYSTLDGLSSNGIRSICNWKGNLYVGTNAGLNRMNQTGIINGKTLANELNVCPENEKAVDGYIYMVKGAANRLMVSSNFHNGVQSYCPTGDMISFSCSAFEWSNDTAILASWGRIVTKRIDTRDNSKHKIKWEEISKGKEYFVIKDQYQKGYLVGSSEGLYQCDQNLNNINEVTPPDYEALIFHDAIFTSPDDLWLATNQGLLHRKKNHWERLTKKDGLSSNYITSLEVDSDNRIWIGTNQGVDVFYDHRFIAYNEGSGLISNLISDIHFFSGDSTIWIGTNKGLSSIRVNGLQLNKNKTYPLFITGVDVIGDSSYKGGEHLELKAKQNNLSIHFAALCYNSPDQVSYQYKLVPGDTNWRNCTSNQVDFFSLSPNQYTFLVRAKTSGNLWGNASRFGFTIQPAVWDTWQFRLFAVLAILLLSWLFFRQRLNKEKARQQRRNQLLTKVSYLEQQALSLSMNPHFIFNSLNSLQSFFKPQKNPKANSFIADFARLIRLNMEASHKKRIALSEEISRLELYLSLEKSRIEKHFDFEIITTPELDLEFIKTPNMLIQPLVENAIWHGILPSKKDGFLRVSFVDKGYLEVTVEDNGIGIEAASKHKRTGHISQGLSISKERLKHLSEYNSLTLEEVYSETGEVLGTRATLIIHLDDEY